VDPCCGRFNGVVFTNWGRATADAYRISEAVDATLLAQAQSDAGLSWEAPPSYSSGAATPSIA
jgi:hypothetical protein